MCVPWVTQAQVSMPFSEAFGTSSIPTGWARYQGLVDQVISGEAELATVTGNWNFGSSNGYTGCAYINNFGTSKKHWLVSPSIEVSGTNVQMSFDLSLTAYSGTMGAPALTGTDDRFIVLVSTDEGASWSILREWNNNEDAEYVYNEIPYAAYENVAIDFSEYSGQTVKIAFYCESTVSNADNNLHIDNVLVEELLPCAKVLGVNVSNITNNSARINWTIQDGQSATYVIYNNGQEVATTAVGATYYDLTDLTGNTTYSTYSVKANCGGEGLSSAVNVEAFTTFCDPEEFPYSINFDELSASVVPD